jgi:hypothetical protein
MREFQTNVEATRLIDIAHRAAVSKLEGIEADDSALRRLALMIRSAVLVQVGLGMWSKLGVTKHAEMMALTVTCSLDQSAALRGEPPIRIQYDFSRTKLSTLIVEHKQPS